MRTWPLGSTDADLMACWERDRAQTTTAKVNINITKIIQLSPAHIGERASLQHLLVVACTMSMERLSLSSERWVTTTVTWIMASGETCRAVALVSTGEDGKADIG